MSTQLHSHVAITSAEPHLQLLVLYPSAMQKKITQRKLQFRAAISYKKEVFAPKGRTYKAAISLTPLHYSSHTFLQPSSWQLDMCCGGHKRSSISCNHLFCATMYHHGTTKCKHAQRSSVMGLHFRYYCKLLKQLDHFQLDLYICSIQVSYVASYLMCIRWANIHWCEWICLPSTKWKVLELYVFLLY